MKPKEPDSKSVTNENRQGWSFIETSQQILEKAKSVGTSQKKQGKEESAPINQTDNLSEMEPELQDYFDAVQGGISKP